MEVTQRSLGLHMKNQITNPIERSTHFINFFKKKSTEKIEQTIFSTSIKL